MEFSFAGSAFITWGYVWCYHRGPVSLRLSELWCMWNILSRCSHVQNKTKTTQRRTNRRQVLRSQIFFSWGKELNSHQAPHSFRKIVSIVMRDSLARLSDAPLKLPLLSCAILRNIVDNLCLVYTCVKWVWCWQKCLLPELAAHMCTLRAECSTGSWQILSLCGLCWLTQVFLTSKLPILLEIAARFKSFALYTHYSGLIHDTAYSPLNISGSNSWAQIRK